MKDYARAAVVAVLSVGIAMALSVLPQPDGNGFPGAEQAVFRPEQPVRLTQDNLVDALVALPLKLDIARADVQQSALSVDLFYHGGAGVQTIYRDLYEISRFAWSSTSNVDRIWVRILSADGETKARRELMLAMEAKRSQAANGYSPESSTISVRDYLLSRYQITYTQKWKAYEETGENRSF